MADSIQFRYAVYFLPRPASDPSKVLHELLTTKYSKLKLVDDIPSNPSEMLIQAHLEKNVQKDYAPPDREALRYSGNGLSAQQESDLQRSEQAFILDFGHPKSSVWVALRTANELVELIARRSNGLVWDEETRIVFTPDAWHQKRLSNWTAEAPNISTQTVIHMYQTKEKEYARAITLGMSKAGLPDVVIDDFSWSSQSQVGNVINLFCQSMAEGAVFGKSGKFKLNVDEIKNDELRESQLKGIKPPGTNRACLSLKPGVWEEGDPKNRLLQLSFDEYSGPDIHAKQEDMIHGLFGSSDSIKQVKHNEELREASRKARAHLPDLQRDFNAGLQPGEYLLVKAPFATPEGNTEWMWVEVTRWKGGNIKGSLANDPFEIPGMHAGQVVEVKEEAVFDYIREYSDKHQEGNTTGEILQKMQSPVDVKEPQEKAVIPRCE